MSRPSIQQRLQSFDYNAHVWPEISFILYTQGSNSSHLFPAYNIIKESEVVIENLTQTSRESEKTHCFISKITRGKTSNRLMISSMRISQERLVCYDFQKPKMAS